jgi:hypothetical protein
MASHAITLRLASAHSLTFLNNHLSDADVSSNAIAGLPVYSLSPSGPPSHILSMARDVAFDSQAQQRSLTNGQLASDCWFAKACQSDPYFLCWTPDETQRCVSRLGLSDPWTTRAPAAQEFTASVFFPKVEQTPTHARCVLLLSVLGGTATPHFSSALLCCRRPSLLRPLCA